MVIWFIGLSGSGKTSISKEFIKRIEQKSSKQIYHLDGDEIRFLFDNKDYTIDGRRKNAKVLSNLCKFLNSKKVIIVASVLSIFPDWQDWNKKNIDDYFEVFVKVEFQKLLEREVKALYRDALDGKIRNVVGVDIEFPTPDSDYVLDNNNDGLDWEVHFMEIFRKLKNKDISL